METTYFKPEISPDLQNLLQDISSKSSYARILLEGRIPLDEIVEEPVNYLGISISDPSKLSYLTRDRFEKISQDEIWSSSKRYQTKPSGVISKIFRKIDYQEMEIFIDSIKSHGSKLHTQFSIATGEEILWWYDEESYDKRTHGSLNSSCMKHKSCQRFFDLYTRNSGTIDLLILRDKVFGTLLGRALLWEVDGGLKIMDRIYTTNDSVYRGLFKDFALENGYLYRTEQSWNSSLWFMVDGKRQYLELSVKLDTTDVHNFPYLDTFKFVDLNNKIFYNYHPKNSERIVVMTSSSGSFHSGDSLEQCQEDLNYYNSSDVIYLDYRDTRVHRNRVVSSDNLNRWIHVDDCRYSEKIEDHLFSGKWEDLNGDIENLDVADLKMKKLEKFRESLVERSPLRAFLSRQRNVEDQGPGPDVENLTAQDMNISEGTWDEVGYDEPTEAFSGHSGIQPVQRDMISSYNSNDEQEISRLLRQELASQLRSSINMIRNREQFFNERPPSLLDSNNSDDEQDINPESQG
jgi:hypothetical protein